MWEKIKSKLYIFIKTYFLFSLRATILSLFLPVMISMIALTGFLSYRLAISQLEENAHNNINDTLFQTKGYIENTLSNSFEQLVVLSNDPRLLSVVRMEEDEADAEDYINIRQLLKAIYMNYNSNIESIYVNINDGNFMMYQSEYSLKPGDFPYQDYMKQTMRSNEDFYWLNSHEDSIFNSNSQVISVLKIIGQTDSKTNGVLVFNLRHNFFEEVIDTSLLGGHGYITLVSPDGELNSKDAPDEYKLNEDQLAHLQHLKKAKGMYEFENPNGKRMRVIYNTIGTNKWKVAAVVATDEIVKKATYIKYVTIAVILILAILSIIIANFLARYISNPVSDLVKQTKLINENNLSLTYNQRGPKEITLLNIAMEEMMVRIHSLLEQIRLEQEDRRQLEFAVLHSQINPHFLYNTLFSIKGLSDMGLNKDASDMITALSNFFRISISKGREIISIEEEFTHIRNYLFIQEMRYGDNFEYVIEMDKSISSYQIIKLTLQPLIENAIYHGVKQTRHKGRVIVKSNEKEDLIYLEVIDNGIGMSEEKLQEIRRDLKNRTHDSTIGIGLRSVHERIRLHFGDPYGILIESTEHVGTRITVIFPKMKEG
ncbi:cache domain-containing sensor histidine kinase [Peribacillus sp. NPDC097675]|uniref:cache domain-containing sensor histidine kinase n=1 Tax=Peribacillus sp. NPDC097675 TaxID=3390618 RepID=UPI003CFC758C